MTVKEQDGSPQDLLPLFNTVSRLRLAPEGRKPVPCWSVNGGKGELEGGAGAQTALGTPALGSLLQLARGYGAGAGRASVGGKPHLGSCSRGKSPRCLRRGLTSRM